MEVRMLLLPLAMHCVPIEDQEPAQGLIVGCLGFIQPSRYDDFWPEYHSEGHQCVYTLMPSLLLANACVDRAHNEGLGGLRSRSRAKAKPVPIWPLREDLATSGGNRE